VILINKRGRCCLGDPMQYVTCGHAPHLLRTG
jgi:hypothetical protein